MRDILNVFIGWDGREIAAFDTCRGSLERRTSKPLHIIPLMQKALRYEGLYWRPFEWRGNVCWDIPSQAPMSTEFAITRFLVPFLQKGGWALFLDGDFFALADVAELFALADERYAVMCVKHVHEPSAESKMDGQPQVPYARKNWSSCVLWNLDHPANGRLTVEMVNRLPGRDLHRFCWLSDDEIGELPVEWNYLVGVTTGVIAPKLVHFTNGFPEMPGCESIEFADAWRKEKLILSYIRGDHYIRASRSADERTAVRRQVFAEAAIGPDQHAQGIRPARAQDAQSHLAPDRPKRRIKPARALA